VWTENFAKEKKSGMKIRPNIVTTWGQFHQHFTCTFLPIYPFDKKSPSRSVIREKMCKTLSYEKRTRKMLMKLTSVGSWVVCSSRRWLSKITHNNIIYGTYCLKHLVCFSKACLIKKGWIKFKKQFDIARLKNVLFIELFCII